MLDWGPARAGTPAATSNPMPRRGGFASRIKNRGMRASNRMPRPGFRR